MSVTPIRSNTIDQSGERSIPSVSIEARLLVELSKGKPIGATITYGEMESAIGRSVRPGSNGYRYLETARRILIRDEGIVLDAVPNVGMKVCDDAEKLAVAGRDMNRARSALKRSKQKLEAADYDKLPAEKRAEYNARMSLLGGLELMSAPKAVALVAKETAGQVLPSAKTLELFR